MSETNGRVGDAGAGGYLPRHAAAQPEDDFLEVMATAADEYRYGQLQKQHEAHYAIERTRLFTDAETEQDKAFIGSQQLLIAKSIGRQATAKEYAEGLRQQSYYVPPDGAYYHGRHRLEDRLPPEEPKPEMDVEDSLEPPVPTWQQTYVPTSSPVPPRRIPKLTESPSPRHASALSSPPPSQPYPIYDSMLGQETSGATADQQTAPPEERSTDEPDFVVPVQRERVGMWRKLQHAYYAGVTAVSTYFMHPDKGRRRRVTARMAVVVGGIAAAGLASWLGPDLQQHAPSAPYATGPAGPPPNTEQFFDTIHPGNYHGEPFEWTAAANQFGPPQANLRLLHLIQYARGNGLKVDTWGDSTSGNWGVNSVTVGLPGGTHKSYYDTSHKLAIMQWYAGGMASG